jgi:DNA-binding response OmpR family regulator
VRKSARLDQVLMSLGLVDEDQVRRALQRQKVEGGRFGTNLVALGSITEEQLLMALAEQFNLTIVDPDERALSPELVRRMPAEAVRYGRALPLAWNEDRGVLTLAVTDPGDDTLIADAKRAFGARAVRLRLAPDGTMSAVGGRLAEMLELPASGPPDAGGAPGDGTPERDRGIALPELFEAPDDPDTGAAEPAAPSPTRSAILVTRRGSLRSFLPPLFERDGYRLIPVSDEDEARAAFGRPDVERVLVSMEMRETLSDWMRRGRVPMPDAEVMAFASVSESLMANPVSYEMTSGSLKRAVEALADSRAARYQAAIPYGLVASDAVALARDLQMRRVAADALHMAAHLLLPAPFEKTSGSVRWEQPFEDFASSLELAKRIRFPWRLDRLLMAVHALFSGRSEGPDEAAPPASWGEETLLAARVLAVTWYRHICILRPPEESEEALIALRADLRTEMSPLASSEVVERYLALLKERGGMAVQRDDAKVLLVGTERIARVLAPALGRVGRASFTTATLAEAQALMERHLPAALVIDGAEFPREVEKFSRVTKLDGQALIFVLSDASDPAIAMSLLDVGIDDVFTPPHDFDLIAARVNRAIRSRARVTGRDESDPGQFSSDFEVFSFLDLVQMLSQGLKTVRIDLTRNERESAVLFMVNGRIIHAVAGDVLGAEAVYEVIRWEDEGEFTVRQEDPARFPEATIAVATDSVLMDGVRLLDESKR